MTFARHSMMFVLLIDREQEVGPNGQPQVRWSDCVRLAVADAAQPGGPHFWYSSDKIATLVAFRPVFELCP